MNYFLHILIMCEIYIILAMAINLLVGYSGLVSLAQAAFYGIGAYSSAMLLVNLKLPFMVSLAGAIIINIIASIPVIWFSIRLRNLFFSLATISWQIIVFALLYNWTSFTNGSFGIPNIPKPLIFGHKFASLSEFALLAGTIMILIVALFAIVQRTPIARLLQGIRDDEIALITFGKSPAKFKAIAIVLSSGASAVAGCLFATHFNYIDATSFTLDESVLIVSMVLIGGLGTMKGSIAGAIFYVLVPELMRLLTIPDAVAANARMMIYALILIAIIIYKPYGFFGKYKFE